jgi:hypothetical protein
MGRRAVVALAALLLLLAASGAEAGRPGVWTRVTEPTGKNIDQVGFARTSDGVLHVVWVEHAGQKESLWHQGIAADGTLVGAKNAVVSEFDSIGNPDLVVSGDGSLRVFFGGLGPAPNNALNTATAPANGAEWTLQPGRAAQDSAAYAADVGAGTMKNGTPVSAWGTTFGTRVHVGTNPADADISVQTACCGYFPDVASADARDQAVVVWYSNASGAAGLFAQAVSAAGPVGGKRLLPGSVAGANSLAPDGRVVIVARAGGGTYVGYGAGYPTYKTVDLWRFGAARPSITIPAAAAGDVSVAASTDGRLWLMWHVGTTVYATRTNKLATRAGAVVAVKPPSGTTTIWKLDGEGSLGPLDVLASVTTPGSLATWHTQVLPKLSLAASGGEVLHFRVTDAGDPVAGAKVKVGRRTLTTDTAGRAHVDLARGKVSATASAVGYVASDAVQLTSR